MIRRHLGGKKHMIPLRLAMDLVADNETERHPVETKSFLGCACSM